MKKIMVIALVVALLTSIFTGCSKPEETPVVGQSTEAAGSAQGEGSEKVYRVAYIARAQADAFAAWLANAVMEEAGKYDNIKLDVFDGQAADDTVNGLIENAIANKYDAIIVQPNNGEAQRPYVEKAVAAGIVTITTNARISGIEGASSVDADPYAQAAVNAQAAIEQIPQDANVVVLLGPPGNFHADARRESWQKEFFEKRPDVKIVGEEIANWNKDEAMNFMETWVQANSKIDAIIAMNDNMAAGAIEVVKGNPAFAEILAYGVDGTAEACLLIKDGLMTSTSLQSAYDLASSLLVTVDKLVTGQETQIDTDIDCPLINQDNVDQYIEMHKKAGALQ
ncbi:sugar ABC transporter substrate-binding protein [Anaerotalea alkaliphila]|uniref:Sugar ABC transporter substrate-binding protein n=1 Tax=Anaerotalea alkaliphila TaxID=2662126 RepID=A0A7X5HY81_9FIRM|nr:sugar ABC transporter substrate-binding protein [Anaerotalea alkaliphila]NDL68844.1 sugar ABC transporter substrate-binding protein [Anaerotalea alkaliphila]